MSVLNPQNKEEWAEFLKLVEERNKQKEKERRGEDGLKLDGDPLSVLNNGNHD